MITLGLGGDAKCRWADKVFGVVFSNGTSAFNNEVNIALLPHKKFNQK